MSPIKKKKNNTTKYMVLCIITIIVMIILLFLIFRLLKPSPNKNIITSSIEKAKVEENQPENEMSEEEEIKNLSESSRIKRYIGMFFEDIEEGNYQEPYNKLNSEFKKEYFPTLEEFSEYAKKNFGKTSLQAKYENIERLGNSKTGNMYVVWVVIDDLIQLKKTAEQEENTRRTNFVIIEYDYNNYEISFSVIGEE